MFRGRPLSKFLGGTLPTSVGIIIALVLLTTLSVWSAQNPAPPKNGEILSSPSAVNNMSAQPASHQKDDPKKSNLEKTKSDAAELSSIADQLRDELKDMNVNVLSLDVLQKTEEVEKLAKKIKGEANGY
jgi:hypothetical protein